MAKQKGDLLKKISQEQKEFFSPDSDKKKLATDIRKLKIDLLITQLELMVKTQGIETKPSGTNRALAKQTAIYLQTIGWKNIIKDLQKLKTKPELPLHFFDWKLDFPEVMNEQVTENIGFDIVIANPPYVSWYSKQARVLDSNIEKALRSNYKFLNEESPKLRINSAMFFMEKGFELLKKDGFIVYIQDLNVIENPFKPIRKYITDNFKLKELIIGLKAFENVGSGQVIFSGYKSKAVNSFLKIQESLEKKNIVYLEQMKIIDYDYSWIISANQKLLLKIEKDSEILGESYESHTGVAVNATEEGKAYFIKDSFIKNSYPFLKGGSSVYESFCTPSINAFLLFDKVMESKLNDEFDKLYFKNKGSHQRPFNLRRADEYNRPKIFIRQSDIKFTATYIEDFVFGNYSLFNLFHTKNDKKELLYLLAILNSKLLTFYGKETEIILIKAGKTPQIRSGQRGPKGIKQLPIKKCNNQTKQLFKGKVEIILSQKSKDKDTTDKEKEIDNLVYKLYELTYNEVKVIDPEFSLSKKEYEAIELE
ncbi:MAG: TaqI-like C-terminal specificity domain-containing protein [Paludibacter sp.]|nr:TaqI-like C-terminal specificity domain-containing protein [Paludibacter sp.]